MTDWQTYEEVSKELIDNFKEEFGLQAVEGKQHFVGKNSGTEWVAIEKNCAKYSCLPVVLLKGLFCNFTNIVVVSHKCLLIMLSGSKFILNKSPSSKLAIFELHLAVFLFGISGLFGKLVATTPSLIVVGRGIFILSRSIFFQTGLWPRLT